MKDIFLVIILSFFVAGLYAQNDSIRMDEKYLEDQLYFNFSYNSLSKTPKGLLQNGFSYGISLGAIKDIPFNKKRTIGLGIGFGYGYNTFNQNLQVGTVAGTTNFSLPTSYSSNRYAINSLEVPVEFRWRTSTPTKYKFWRIYGGMTFSYILNFKSKFVGTSEIIHKKNITEVNKLQYGLSMAAGYGTWNFYANYSLTPLFEKGTKLNTGENIDFSILRIGLMFYIL